MIDNFPTNQRNYKLVQANYRSWLPEAARWQHYRMYYDWKSGSWKEHDRVPNLWREATWIRNQWKILLHLAKHKGVRIQFKKFWYWLVCKLQNIQQLLQFLIWKDITRSSENKFTRAACRLLKKIKYSRLQNV